MRLNLIAAGLTLALAGPALAQAPNNPAQNTQTPAQHAQTPAPQAQTPARHEAIEQQVRANLQNAGFTDIKIMPQSFLVRAKDKSGNPVMMVINPDSITSLTEIDQPKGQSTTTGAAAPNAAQQNTSQKK